VADVYDIKMQKDFYDVIFAEQSLHHFSPLKEILFRIANFLKPNGFLIVNEFVGPTRFQWTDKQLKIVNNLLLSLPDKYKRRWKSNSIKSKVFRPSRLSMILDDPSEAIESSKILPLLTQIFNVTKSKNMEELFYSSCLVKLPIIFFQTIVKLNDFSAFVLKLKTRT